MAISRESISRFCVTADGVKIGKVAGIGARGFIFVADDSEIGLNGAES